MSLLVTSCHCPNPNLNLNLNLGLDLKLDLDLGLRGHVHMVSLERMCNGRTQHEMQAIVN